LWGIFLGCRGFSQFLDQLNSDEAIVAYILKTVPNPGDGKLYEKFSLSTPVAHPIDGIKHPAVLKGDFDHDGKEDRFIRGAVKIDLDQVFKIPKWLFMTDAKRKPTALQLPFSDYSMQGDIIKFHCRKIAIHEKEYIECHRVTTNHFDSTKLETQTDTLYVLSRYPAKFTLHPDKRKIASIHYETTYCTGSCPVFQLTVYPDRMVDYHGEAYVKRQGSHKLALDPVDWKFLKQQIQNLNINGLKNRYAVNWTCSTTATMTVRFTDGSSKSISDYGNRGTPGLELIHDFFYKLVESLH